MTRKADLTEAQMRMIREHIDMFPAEVKKLPGFDGDSVSRDTIRHYQGRIKKMIAPAGETDLAAQIRKFINLYGLPARFHGHGGVTGFVDYLEKQKDLRGTPSLNQ